MPGPTSLGLIFTQLLKQGNKSIVTGLASLLFIPFRGASLFRHMVQDKNFRKHLPVPFL